MIKYTKSGNKVKVIVQVDNKFLVESYVEYCYGDQIEEGLSGVIHLEDELFDSPPKQVLCEEVCKLNKEISEKRQELFKLKKDIQFQKDNLEKEEKELLNKFKKVKALSFIDDFINNKFNFFVVKKYTGFCEVFEFEKLLEKDYYSRDKGFKLLTLFGKSNGDLQWGINNYPDGSGTNSEILLFKTLEEAQKFVYDTYLSILEEEINMNSKKIVEFLQSNNVEIPSKILDSYNEFVKKDKEEKLKDINNKIQNLLNLKKDLE